MRKTIDFLIEVIFVVTKLFLILDLVVFAILLIAMVFSINLMNSNEFNMFMNSLFFKK